MKMGSLVAFGVMVGSSTLLRWEQSDQASMGWGDWSSWNQESGSFLLKAKLIGLDEGDRK